MEGDDDEPAAGLEQALGGGKAFGELAELIVEIEPERLERSRRRVLGLIAFPAEHAHDDLGELAGRGDGLLAAAGDDGFGDRAGPPLLAELADDLGKLLLG